MHHRIVALLVLAAFAGAPAHAQAVSGAQDVSSAQAVSRIAGTGEVTAGPALQNEFKALADPSVSLDYTVAGPTTAQAAFLNQTSGAPVDFALGYQTVTPDQVSAWNAAMSATAGNLIALPAFVMPVSIAFTYPYARTLLLTDDDLCGIFSGRVTDWGALKGTVSPNQRRYPLSGPIAVLYRSDDTQTTAVLTRHLAAVCTAANAAIPFQGTGLLATLFPGGMPANFAPVGSTAAMQTAMAGAVSNAIGYMEAGYTGLTPTLPTARPAIRTAKIVNAANGKAYFATPSSVIAALRYPGAGAIDAAPPATADSGNQTLWTPQIPTPGLGYPLVGYTTVMLAQCYHDPAIAQGLVNQLFGQYSVTLRTSVTDAGFQQVPALFEVPINRLFLNKFRFPACSAATCLGIGAGGVTSRTAPGYAAACALRPGL